jgi:hypothetical protein
MSDSNFFDYVRQRKIAHLARLKAMSFEELVLHVQTNMHGDKDAINEYLIRTAPQASQALKEQRNLLERSLYL